MAMIECPECGHNVSDRAEACPNCGFPVADYHVAPCPECGRPVSNLDDACPNCGFPLTESEQAPAGGPEPASPTEARPVDHSLAVSHAPDTREAPAPSPPSEVTTIRKRRRPGIIKFWLWLLPILVVIPAASTYFFGQNQIDIPFLGSFDLAAEAAAVVAGWGFISWVSLTTTFLPILIAYGRRTRNRGTVAVVNIVLGLTGIGWIVALIMAFSSDVDPPLYVEKTTERTSSTVSASTPAPEIADEAVDTEEAPTVKRAGKQRWTTTLIMALVLVAVIAGIYAWTTRDQSDAQGSPTQLVSGGTLILCIEDVPVPPMWFEDASGNATGFEVELMRAIATDLGLELQVVSTSFDRMVTGLAMEAGECDITAGLGINSDRERDVDFSDSHFQFEDSLLVRKDSGLRSLSEFSGRALAVIAGTTAEAYAIENAPQGTQIIAFETFNDAFAALRAGSVQGVLSSLIANAAYAAENEDVGIVERFPTELGVAFAVKEEGAEELLEAVNTSLRKLKDNGTYDRIWNDWFGL